MSSKRTSKKTKIVGTTTYINKTTGELEEMQVIQIQDNDANFHKIWLAHMLEALDLIGNQKIRVMDYLLSHMNKENMVITTQRKIADELNVSIQTVSLTLSALKEANFLASGQQGVYRLNPNAIFKGYSSQRMSILLQYSTEVTVDEQKKKTRKAKKSEVVEDKPLPGQETLDL